MTFDGNSDFTVPRLAIGQYDGFADKLGLRLLEFGKNFRRVSFRGRHRGAREHLDDCCRSKAFAGSSTNVGDLILSLTWVVEGVFWEFRSADQFCSRELNGPWIETPRCFHVSLTRSSVTYIDAD